MRHQAHVAHLVLAACGTHTHTAHACAHARRYIAPNGPYTANPLTGWQGLLETDDKGYFYIQARVCAFVCLCMCPVACTCAHACM